MSNNKQWLLCLKWCGLLVWSVVPLVSSADYSLMSRVSYQCFGSGSYSNTLCALGISGNTCKSSGMAIGSSVADSASYISSRSGVGTADFSYSCHVSGLKGNSLSCDAPAKTANVRWGSGCNGPFSSTTTLSGFNSVSVVLPADATQITYGINSHGICYRTSSPGSIQCRAVTVDYSSSTWSFGAPVTLFTSSELDNDGDALADDVDADDDSDGVADLTDNCPLDANAAQTDTDDDGFPDACTDYDDDNDGVADTGDAFPLDPTETVDTDHDGTGNNTDLDDDNDGVADEADNCPLNANAEQADRDGDAQGDACDADDDNDGVVDTYDKFPLNPAVSVDSDLDGVPTSWNTGCDANCQNNSGLVLDNCPYAANANQLDTDGDAQGDACDADDDNDGVVDWADAFPLNAAESVDTDSDGTGNNTDSDDDNDGLPDVMDPLPLQVKFNRDGSYKGSVVNDRQGVQ